MSLGDWYLNGTKLSPLGFANAEAYRIAGGDVELLDGGLRRDIRARKLEVAMSWEYLPEHFDGTYHALTDLKSLGTSSGTMTFLRPTGTSTGTTSYRVFCDPPESELAHRSAGTVFWNVSMTVREA